MAIYRRSKARRKVERQYRGTKEHLTKPSSHRKRSSTHQQPSSDQSQQQEQFLFHSDAPEPTPFYRFMEDWNRGVMPSNKDLLNFFGNWVRSPIFAEDARLSPAGRSLNADLRLLGELLARLIKDRNQDGILQRFAAHLRLAARLLRSKPKSGRVTVMEDPKKRRWVRLFGWRDVQLQRELAQTQKSLHGDVRNLMTLGQLIISSPDFRQLVMNMQKLVNRVTETTSGDEGMGQTKEGEEFLSSHREYEEKAFRPSSTRQRQGGTVMPGRFEEESEGIEREGTLTGMTPKSNASGIHTKASIGTETLSSHGQLHTSLRELQERLNRTKAELASLCNDRGPMVRREVEQVEEVEEEGEAPIISSSHRATRRIEEEEWEREEGKEWERERQEEAQGEELLGEREEGRVSKFQRGRERHIESTDGTGAETETSRAGQKGQSRKQMGYSKTPIETQSYTASEPTIEIYPPGRRPLQEQPISTRSRSSRRGSEEDELSPSERQRYIKILEDAKPLLRHIAANREFKNALKEAWWTLLHLQKTVIQKDSSVGTLLSNDLTYDANFAAAQRDLLEIIQRFADGVSLQPLIDALSRIREQTINDYELLDFMQDWRSFLHLASSRVDYMDREEFTSRGLYLLRRTASYVEHRYKRLFGDVLQAWNRFIEGWNRDKLTNQIGTLLTRIINQDIFGQPEAGGQAARGLLNLSMIQPGLLNDLRNFTLPAAIRALHELPLPHIEIEQAGIRLALDSIVLPASMLAPADLDIRTQSHMHLAPRERIFSRRRARRRIGPDQQTGTTWRSGARLAIAGLSGEIPNIRFVVDKSTWPRLRDEGLCDVRVGGRKGLSIATDIATDISLDQRRFHIEPVFVRVNVDRMRLRFRGVRHRTMFSIMRPYLQVLMKRRLERALRDRIVTTIEQVDVLARRLAKGVAIPNA